MNRNYNDEIIDNERKYAYSFDFDVMHSYMMRTFEPFAVKGNALELGCFQGRFTERLVEMFSDVTCIEASSEAVKIAKSRIGDKAKFINSLFEDADLNATFDNIFLTHVLEHIDNRIELLKKIKNEWLSDKGVLYVVCPNANAPSRQLAVKMGLIDHNEAVTEAERKHGHRVTYTLSTLENDIKKSGLKVVFKSGIFFKALANFQMDMVIKQKIVSKEYLDACYELGQIYPDLCASICFICKK